MKYLQTFEPPKLNLVALMDIFTILVFFLMVNSSDVEVMQSDAAISLPTANAEAMVGTTLNISVVNDVLIVQGLQVAKISAVKLDGENIPELRQELEYQAQKRSALTEEEMLSGRAVTFFADQTLPYEVLRLILATCAETDYRDVSLAVDKAKALEVTSVY